MWLTSCKYSPLSLAMYNNAWTPRGPSTPLKCCIYVTLRQNTTRHYDAPLQLYHTVADMSHCGKSVTVVFISHCCINVTLRQNVTRHYVTLLPNRHTMTNIPHPIPD